LYNLHIIYLFQLAKRRSSRRDLGTRSWRLSFQNDHRPCQEHCWFTVLEIEFAIQSTDIDR